MNDGKERGACGQASWFHVGLVSSPVLIPRSLSDSLWVGHIIFAGFLGGRNVIVAYLAQCLMHELLMRDFNHNFRD